jgi:hypothetical protein
MPDYRITYDTTVSVSLTLTFENDDEALVEERSQALVEEHFNGLGFAVGPRAVGMTVHATVDGMAPSEISRIENGKAVRIQ